MKLTLMTLREFASLRGKGELSIELPTATLYLSIEPTTLESYDLTLAVEARGGESVTTVAELASLLGCGPTEEQVARCLDEAISRHALSRWETI